MYVGTYNVAPYTEAPRAEGLFRCAFDADSGRLEVLDAFQAGPNPSYLAFGGGGRFLYAVNELSFEDGRPVGALSAFRLAPGSGALELLSRQETNGADPCHLALDPSGRHVLVANYGSGSVSVHPVAADGGVGPAGQCVQHQGASVHERQAGPHAHSVTFLPGGVRVLVADLGADRLMLYRFQAGSGRLEPDDPPWLAVTPGAGPRHVALHPGGRWLYVAGELGSTVTACSLGADGAVAGAIQEVSSLPEGFSGQSTGADIHLSADGRHLYASNRGHDSIAAFSVEEGSGLLRPAGHCPTGGARPRNFTLDPSGRYLLVANQDSDSVVVLARDPESGGLSATGRRAAIPTPVCVKALPG